MQRCATCAHWEAYRPDADHVLRGAGQCHAAVELWEASTVERDPESKWYTSYRKLKPEAAGVLAFVMDGSTYRAELVTMPSFGCVQHKE